MSVSIDSGMVDEAVSLLLDIGRWDLALQLTLAHQHCDHATAEQFRSIFALLAACGDMDTRVLASRAFAVCGQETVVLGHLQVLQLPE